jgi:hypothetical protein
MKNKSTTISIADHDREVAALRREIRDLKQEVTEYLNELIQRRKEEKNESIDT